jgi:hypothetical protein
MSNAIYGLLSQLEATMNTFSKLGDSLTKRLLNQLKTYGNLSDGQESWMRIKGVATPVFVMASVVSSLAKGFYSTDPQPTYPHIEVDDFIQQLAINIAEKLSDDQFMRTTFKVTSKVLPSLGKGVETLVDSHLTKLEAKRSILNQVDFQKTLEGLNASQNLIDKLGQLSNSIIAKAAPAA